MRAEFEEKVYESYFNSELSQRYRVYHPIGQVQEGSLGFDSAVLAKEINYQTTMRKILFSGAKFEDIASHMEGHLKRELKNLPPGSVNLLFQYKRPEYITRSNGKEWHHWNHPYYRYDIYEKQQDLLMEIYKEFKDEILIVYASPAIHRIQELVEIHTNRKIIEYSNFKEAYQLENHKRNTYQKQGIYSIACSESEEINNVDISELIEKGESYITDTGENSIESILNFINKIVSVTNENEYYSKPFRQLNELVVNARLDSAVIAR